MENSAAGFFSWEKGRSGLKLIICGSVRPKCVTTNLTQTVCLRLCGELFCFAGLTRSFSWTHGLLPVSSIHSFFRSKASASRNSSVRMLALPQVRKRGIQSPAGQRRPPPDGSGRDEMIVRPDIFSLPAPASPRSFENGLSWAYRILGPAALCQQRQPLQSSHRYKAVNTSCPSCTSTLSRLRYSFLPWVQVKLSSSA